jgi:hypothetical protein
MTPHPQYNKLIAIANGDQMQSTQFREGGYERAIFKNCDPSTALYILSSESDKNWARLRIKPTPTIMIGDMEVPEPLRVAPARGSAYWFITLFEVVPDYWDGGDEGKQHLALGICQATEQGAKDMLDALVKQLGGVL